MLAHSDLTITIAFCIQQCCGSTGTGVRAELPRYKTLLLSHNKTCFLNVFYSAEYFQCTGTGGVSAESPDYKYSLLLSHNETCLFFPIQDGIISVPVNRDMSF